MLGHHLLLRHELKKNGRRAFATVVECKRTHILDTEGDPSLVSSTRRLWKLVLRVEPQGASPFEAKVDELLPQLSSTAVGDRFPVLYDPGDHSKVVVDHSEEGDEGLVNEQIKEHTEEQISRMRGHGQGEMADRLQAVYDAGLLNYSPSSMSDPAELRRQIHERQAQIKEIMGGQNVLIGGQPVQTGGAAGAGLAAEALTKLADLRDRGVLTNEEFDAQKRKVLGE